MMALSSLLLTVVPTLLFIIIIYITTKIKDIIST